MQSLKLLPVMASFEEYISLCARIVWCANSRPAVSCFVSQSTQVKRLKFQPTSIHNVTKAVRRLIATANLGLRYPKLDRANYLYRSMPMPVLRQTRIGLLNWDVFVSSPMGQATVGQSPTSLSRAVGSHAVFLQEKFTSLQMHLMLLT
jgi:hypothetical protein